MVDGGFDGSGNDGSDGPEGFDGSGLGHFDGHGFEGIDGVYDGFDFGQSGEGQATFDAIVVSHSFCSNHSHSGDVDNGVDIGQSHFGGHGNLDGIGATLTGALNPSKEVFGVAVYGHSYIDLTDVVTTALRSRQLMELYTPLGGRKRVPPTNHFAILPRRPASKGQPALMPHGYYPGATGLTTHWRSFWQLGKQTFWDKLAGKPLSLDSKRRWNIEVSVKRWYFGEADDYETQVLANVWSPHMGRNSNSQDRLEQLAIARDFIKDVAERLGRCTPSEHSTQYRNKISIPQAQKQ